MDIYEVLRTKPHSERHLVRYVKFIQSRQFKEGPLERHHICPKAKDLFPEYSSFKEHPWNRIDLTPREHYIAHLLLWKTFGGSQSYAISFMAKASRMYAKIRNDVVERNKLRLTGSNLSELTKVRISESRSGQTLSKAHREKISSACQGRVMSEDSKMKISTFQKTRLRAPYSEATKLKMKASQQRRRLLEQTN